MFDDNLEVCEPRTNGSSRGPRSRARSVSRASIRRGLPRHGFGPSELHPTCRVAWQVVQTVPGSSRRDWTRGFAPSSVPRVDNCERVRRSLLELRRAIDPQGLVVDPDLQSRIVRAHADSGMPADAVVRIVLAKPAPPERIAHLQTTCKKRFGVELPEDYATFLREHDGLLVGDDISQDAGDRMADNPHSFSDHAIMSTLVIREWMDSTVVDTTRPDGSTSREPPPILPFYDIVEVGFHAFDLSAVGPGQPPVVDVDGEQLWEAGGHERLAPSFALWLDAFIRAGLEPFATASLLQLTTEE